MSRAKRTPVVPAVGVTKLRVWRWALVKVPVLAIVQTLPLGEVSTR